MTDGSACVELTQEMNTHEEIWISFESTLRSYAGLAGAEFVVTNFADLVEVKHQGRFVRFALNPATGQGIWDTQQASGKFTMHEDGTLQFENEPEALDMAAVRWIAWLGRESDGDEGI